MLLAGTALAQDANIVAQWDAPTEGSPVVHYIFQLSTDGGPFVTLSSTIVGTTFEFTAPYNQTYVARVAGIDDQLRQGPYSLDSDPYTPDMGLPGAPGKPIVFEGPQ